MLILNFNYKVYAHKSSNTSCHLQFKMATLLSSEGGEADVPTDISLENSVQSDVPAHLKARRILRQPGCDPRDPNLFQGIDISVICDREMDSLRELLCGALSVRDRRPWSCNGKRTSVLNLTTFLGTNFDIAL